MQQFNDLSSFSSWFSNNWIESILWLFAILIAYIFYKLSCRDKLPYFAIRNVNLIEGATSRFKHLGIHYSGYSQNLENFSVAVIAFWNAGRGTITRRDIAPADPLEIRAQNGSKILATTITQENKSTNQFRCITDPSHEFARINFEYIDFNDGAVIEILHTGLTENDIKLCGTIIGASSLTRMKTDPTRIIINFGKGIKYKISPYKRKQAFGIFCLALGLIPTIHLGSVDIYFNHKRVAAI